MWLGAKSASSQGAYLPQRNCPVASPLLLRRLTVVDYVCGSPLLPSSSPYFDSIVVRQSLLCTDPVEVQYYSSTLMSFPSICFYCGTPEEALVDDSGIQELRLQYTVVRPICFLCRSSGKRPATRQANNTAKRSKRAKLSK